MTTDNRTTEPTEALIAEALTPGRRDKDLVLEARKIRAERDAAFAREAKVREAVARHPKCDRYDDDGPISCGWKSAFRDVVRALDADGKETNA